jgi:acyl-CoA thioesterase-1
MMRNGGKKRVVVLGDSLGMPRPDEEGGITYEETYPYLLNGLLGDRWEVISRCRRANISVNQAHIQYLYDDITVLTPDFVVLHLGIVDCAPRLFSPIQNRVLSKVPNVLRKPIISFFSRYRSFFTKLFPKVYVGKRSYETHMRKIIAAVQKAGAICLLIEISKTSEKNEDRSFGIDQNILDYNAIIRRLGDSSKAIIVSADFDPEECLMADGIHINIKGSQKLASQLMSIIKEKSIETPR